MQVSEKYQKFQPGDVVTLYVPDINERFKYWMPQMSIYSNSTATVVREFIQGTYCIVFGKHPDIKDNTACSFIWDSRFMLKQDPPHNIDEDAFIQVYEYYQCLESSDRKE